MVSKATRRVVWLATSLMGFVVVCIAVAFILIDRPIERDELHGLKIGMRKAEVIEVMIQNQVTDVIPEVDEVIVVEKSNLDSLSRLKAAMGICVNDGMGVAVTIGFNQRGERISFYESVKKLPGLSDIRTRDEFFVVLHAAISETPRLVASNCIPESRWISLRDRNQDDLVYLSSFNTWSYHEPGSYSSAKITFAGDVLSRIEYRWRPFELP